MVSIDAIKELREITGAPIMECRRALEEAEGDIVRAQAILRERGVAAAAKRAGREVLQGVIDAYVHGDGRIGAMIEVNCETDFVARTEAFRELAHNLVLQVAATNPTYVSPEEMPPDAEGSPEELCLLLQPFIKDPSRTVNDLVVEAIAKTGENIQVRRFVRFGLGT